MYLVHTSEILVCVHLACCLLACGSSMVHHGRIVYPEDQLTSQQSRNKEGAEGARISRFPSMYISPQKSPPSTGPHFHNATLHPNSAPS